MPASQLNNVGLTYNWETGENLWGDPLNSNLGKIDALLQSSVEDTITALPGSPLDGQMWLVADSGTTGSLIGHENKLAIYYDGAFNFVIPKEGWEISHKTKKTRLRRNSSNKWESAQSSFVTDNVSTLITIPTPVLPSGKTVEIEMISYHPNWSGSSATPLGGGRFVWDATKPKSQHNGGTIISPTVPWDGTQTSLAAFLAGTGETNPSGNGCWVRIYSGSIYPEWFGAKIDGTSDDTSAVQKAVNSHQEIYFGPGTWRISAVDVPSNRTFSAAGEGVTIFKKYGSAGISSRGVWRVQNNAPTNFDCHGGTGATYDLNGEALNSIGVVGKIANTYNTVSGITGVAGPENAAIFALRASNIKFKGEIKNTGESGLLFRNCGDINVDVRLENICGNGVEFSFPAADGGTGAMPERARLNTNVRRAKDIDDLKLGAGNGVGVTFAGSAVNEAFRHIRVTGNFDDCCRDVHCEFSAGSYIQDFHIAYTSRNARQGSMALVGAKDGFFDIVAENVGYGPCGALNTGYPDIYGVIGSTTCENVQGRLILLDRRNSQFYKGTDGAISAGDNVFTSASASFQSADIGTYIGVAGAGSSTGAALIAKIAGYTSATQVTLDRNAITTVSGANYGYGGATRIGVKMSSGSDISIDGYIEAGTSSGLAGEPASYAVYYGVGSGTSRLNGRIKAPATRGTVPNGVGIASGFGGKIIKNAIVSGYTNNYTGFSVNTTSTFFPPRRVLVSNALPNAAIDTYGTDVVSAPRSDSYIALPVVSVEFDNISAETVTCVLEATFIDGGMQTVTLTASSNSTQNLTAQQIATLHRDNQVITTLKHRAKSSKASSTARARLSFLGLENAG